YTLDEGGKGAVLKVAETVLPVKASAATGFTRRFVVEAPAGYRTWLLAGQTTKAPRVVGVNAPVPTLDLTADEPQVSAVGTRVVLPQDADRAVVLEALAAPEGSVWRFVKTAAGWSVVLRLPEAKAAWKGTFELVLWALPKDD